MTGDLPDYHEYVVWVSTPPSPTVTNPKRYEGSVAVSGTPVTLNVNTDLGRNAGDGYIINNGPGKLLIDLSNDGTTFETDITVKRDEILDLRGLNVHTIRIDATVSGTAYRGLVV